MPLGLDPRGHGLRLRHPRGLELGDNLRQGRAELRRMNMAFRMRCGMGSKRSDMTSLRGLTSATQAA